MNNEGKSYYFNSDSLKALDGQFVEGYISTGDKDLVNDIITANCMVDMLAQMKNRIVTLDVEHETFRGKDHVEREINKSLNPIAKIVEASLDGKGIKVKTQLNPHNPRYEEIEGSIQDEFLNAFSIAYVPVDFKNREDGTRLLDKVNLLNVTFTGVPVNPEASITNVMLKSLNDGGISMVEQKVQAEAKAVDAGVKLENLEVKSLSEKVDSLAKELSELKAMAKKKAEADEEDEDKEKEAKADAEKEEDDDLLPRHPRSEAQGVDCLQRRTLFPGPAPAIGDRSDGGLGRDAFQPSWNPAESQALLPRDRPRRARSRPVFGCLRRINGRPGTGGLLRTFA